MTIGIVTGFSFKDAAGLEQALIELLVAFEKDKPRNVDYVIYTGTSRDIERALSEKNLTSFRVVHIGWGAFWKYVGLFFAPKSDVYFYNGPLTPPFLAPRPSCVLVYDFAYKYDPIRSWRMRVRQVIMDFLTGRAFRQAKAIVAISQATRADIGRFFGKAAEEKTTITHLGFKDISMTPITEVSLPLRRYFLFVGTVKERKNVLNLIRGYIHAVKEAAIEEELIIAGRFNPGSPYGEQLRQELDAANLSGRGHFLGQVSDAELHYLYLHSLAFLFPSKLEGFGMPVLEAMSLGVPVLTSTASSLPEVAGEAALLVDPDDSVAIGGGIARLSTDEALRDKLSQKGKVHAARFSWSAAARALNDIFRNLYVA